ncbi:Asp/Glu racemase [Microdochium trichocladiopsis]|uniref:Asp/Glu racemase n=1 Tax=Microdochium trichocladiopsis TaxID=1682393 RepID=A0A9P8Y734_9PEZI|nr:Asp/Glu racemase [Microdochium trichocladiopsis]KAH7029346.1 Asp/Glu racemase [Microdochium trichocladiopsis]
MPLKLGVLVPSSNTALEPLTTAILASLGSDVSVHFSRFPVTTISLDPTGLAQFSLDGPIMTAARLLADAKVDVIGWSGTSGGWLGFDADEKLCRIIAETLGVPATTSTLALNKALDLVGAKRLAFVTPYLDDVQERIIQVYNAAGYRVVAESHSCIAENTRIADRTAAELDAQVSDVLNQAGNNKNIDAITTFCTNLSAAHLVVDWEARHGVPVFDTVTTVIWDMLRLVKYDKVKITGWGQIFTL